MPALEPHLMIQVVRPLVSGLKELGHDPAPVLASASIDAMALRNPDARVPWGTVLSLVVHGDGRHGQY